MSLEKRLVQHIVNHHSGEAAVVVAQLPPQEGTTLLGELGPQQFAKLLEALPAAKAAALLEGLAPEALGTQLSSCDTRTAAAVLRAMERAPAGRALAAMPSTRRSEVAALVSLPPNTVAAVMEPPPVLLPVGASIQEARRGWSRNPQRHHEAKLWVVDDDRSLVGTLSTWTLATAAPTDDVAAHLGRPPARLAADTLIDVAALDPLWETQAMAAVIEQGRVVGRLPWSALRRSERRAQRRTSSVETAGALRGLYRVAAQSLLMGGPSDEEAASS